MAIFRQESANDLASPPSPVEQKRLRWPQILAISILSLGFSFHWVAIGIIIVPNQVLKIVGDLHKGEALAIVLVPGAFVSLFANPLFGWLSDRTRGRLAAWGRRRPYILVGVLVDLIALFWMATARDIPSLAIGYALAQFSSNAAQATFHALLPDIVPAEQRGLTSGTIGLLQTVGQIGGVLAAGLLIDVSRPFAIYQYGVWAAYGIIAVVLAVLTLITLFSIDDRAYTVEPREGERAGASRGLFPRSAVMTIVGTLAAILAAWGLMALWNSQHMGIQIDGTLQQVVLEVLATIGILRLFDFNPRRDPDFAWVLVTRLVMMLGIFTIENFLQYYMRDAVRAPNPAQATAIFIILVALTGLVSTLVAGWLSDHFGRKRLVYISGFMMALVGVIFIITHSYVLVITAGALFGLGYGAYVSVDWALVVDVLPSKESFARDMGVWNIALSLPQVIAPVLGGPIIDIFTAAHNPVLAYQILFGMAIVYCVVGTITVSYIRGVKK